MAGSQQADQFVTALGGRDNVLSVRHCVARLSITVADPQRVSQAALKKAGSDTVIAVGETVQVVPRTDARALAAEIRDVVGSSRLI